MAQDEASKKAHENTLWKIAGNFISKYYEFLPQLIKLSFEEVQKQFPAPGTDSWNAWADSLIATKGIDRDTANEMKRLFREPFPMNVIYFIFTVIGVQKAEFENFMNVFMLDKQYDILGRTTPHPAPVDNLVRSAIIDPGRTTENRAELKKHGFDETQIDNIFLSYYKTLDEGTLRTLYLRGEITEARLYERMRELGYTDTRTREMVETWKVIPGPQDLLHMVAKEAFEPDMYRLLGLDQNFPTEQSASMEAHGLSEYWQLKYWISHWAQPSIGQGFEMLHRRVINTSELDLLFRAVEIPPYWRDKLTEIAYRPLTRVDVRRMFELDILTEEQVFDSYLDHGYNTENAWRMTRFTVAFKNSHEKELTRGAILESYNEGMISRSEATALLTEQDYSADLADYYLTLEDYNRDKSIQKQRIANTRDEMLLNRIGPAGARTRLNNMGLRGELIDSYLETWELDRYQYQALPSKSELNNFLVKGIINQGQWQTVMNRHGYSGPHIAWYLEDLRRQLDVTRRMPTKADLIKWFNAGSITRVEYTNDMKLLGYSDRYIELYIT